MLRISNPSVTRSLLAAQHVLYRAANRTIWVEVLANHAVGRQWTADLVAQTTNGTLLCEKSVLLLLHAARIQSSVVGLITTRSEGEGQLIPVKACPMAPSASNALGRLPPKSELAGVWMADALPPWPAG